MKHLAMSIDSNAEKEKWYGQSNGPTDGPTDGPKDGRTDKASYGVACPQLKTWGKCGFCTGVTDG